MKTIRVERDIFDHLVAQSTAGETPAQTLRRELRVPEPQQAIDVDDETYAYIVSRMRDVGESASDVLRRELSLGGTPAPVPPGPAPAPPGPAPVPPPPGPAPAPPGTVIFRIPAGTHGGPWNTHETVVVASVGDTLQLINDDDAVHRPHTSGVPFPHPAMDIRPGESASFVLQVPYDAGLSGPLHDHVNGPGAEFWLTVLPAG